MTALGSILLLTTAYACGNTEGTKSGNTAGSSGTGGTSAGAGGSSGDTGGSSGDTGGSSGDTGGSSGDTGGSSGDTGGSSGDTGGSSGTGGTGDTGGAVGTGGSTGTGGAAQACPGGGICHEFIANDNSRHVVNYVNQFDPSKNWTSKSLGGNANSPRTIEIIDQPMASNKKAVLVSIDSGYAEIDLGNGALLKRQDGNGGTSGACRLEDGSTALGISNTIRFINAAGQPIKTIPSGPAGTDLRAINRNPMTGNFWLSKHEFIYEVDKNTGAKLWGANMGSQAKGYAVWWRDPSLNGGAYATTGDPSTVVEVDASGAIVNHVGGKGAMFPYLDFFSGFVRLPNGNFVVANWLGHITPKPDQPHVVEFTPSNTVVWKWGTQTEARQITNVHVFQ